MHLEASTLGAGPIDELQDPGRVPSLRGLTCQGDGRSPREEEERESRDGSKPRHGGTGVGRSAGPVRGARFGRRGWATRKYERPAPRFRTGPAAGRPVNEAGARDKSGDAVGQLAIQNPERDSP